MMTPASSPGTPPRRPRGRLVVFWDYDTQWGADADAARGLLPAPGALEFECTDRLLALHDTFGIAACLAVVGAAALPGTRPYHDPAQIRRIHDAGHEVASHSFAHEWLPGLNAPALRTTLRDSRDALAQCIGADVTTFVPPYNQPFDFLMRGAPSRSERRACRTDRTDVPALCDALVETGYRSCRLAYHTLLDRARAGWGRPAVDRAPADVRGVHCWRLRAPCGFAEPVRAMLRDTADRGTVLVVYGHPHSIGAANAQHESHLVPFLREAQALVAAGRLAVVLPREFAGRSSDQAREVACASVS